MAAGIEIGILVLVVIVLIFLIPGLTGAPYVPTLKAGLKEAFTKLYPFSEKDLLIDLGAGDGVILKEATEHGARALGLEINPILALIIKWRLRKNPLAKVKCRNFYRYKFPPKTTVVYAFAVALHIEAIARKIQREADRLGKPLYFISNAFDIPGKKPKKKVGTFYLYEFKPEKKA